MKEKSHQPLVVGVSTRALFDLETENSVFEHEGVAGYRAFQLENEGRLLLPGTAFHLVESLLQLNVAAGEELVEVVIMSRNSPETGLRVLHALKHYDLKVRRMAFTGGASLAPYAEAFRVDLFLSKDAADVQSVIDSEFCAAALIYAPPAAFDPQKAIVKIAFDADAVIFSDESEFRYKSEGIESFLTFEAVNEDVPLNAGPFANLLLKLSAIQKRLGAQADGAALRIAVVTARSAPSHLRVIKTLRQWGVDVDEAYFLGGLPKEQVLKVFRPHIFFDDQDVHLAGTAPLVPSAKVPYHSESKLHAINLPAAKRSLSPSKRKKNASGRKNKPDPKDNI